MPELPDVEVFRETLERTALHQRIEHVHLEPADLLEGVTARRLEDRLRGHHLVSARRHGKYLFAELSRDGWLVMHFGMTGSLRHLADEESAPDHTRLRLELEDDSQLVYRAVRKLGRITVADDPDAFIEEQGLGPDPLDPGFDEETFLQRLEGRRGSVKSALMNQKVLAGLGNVYADEALYQTRLHPATPLPELGEVERRRLHRTLVRVLRLAIDRGARPERMPVAWLLPHREEGAACPRCHGAIRRITVAGRATYLCPAEQERLS